MPAEVARGKARQGDLSAQGMAGRKAVHQDRIFLEDFACVQVSSIQSHRPQTEQNLHAFEDLPDF